MNEVIYTSCYEPKEIVNILREHNVVDIRNISPGDYVFNHIGIERKTVSDFVASWKSGRLYDQLFRLSACYGRTFLIIEGFESVYFVKPQWLYHVLLECNFRYRTVILFTENIRQTAFLITVIFKKTKRCWHKPFHFYPIHYRKKMSKEERQIQLLCCIKGIGRKRAEKILKEIKSLQILFTADAKELRRLKGLGKNTIKDIKELLV